MSRSLRILSLGLATLTLAACSNDMSDLENYITDIRSRKSTVVEPLPQIRQYEAFDFIPGERRQPFEPEVAERDPSGGNAAENALRPDTNRNREPLESFPLDGLRMMGTLESQGSNYALIKAPDAILHRVSYGNYLGQNYGKIVGISEAEVQLEEIVPDGFGGFMKRAASIALSE